MEAAAVALKFAVEAPAATVTVAGTVSEVLLLASLTAEPPLVLGPPLGAVWESVIVQVLTALWPRLTGLQATPETRTGATRPMVAVCELEPRVAVTVAL